MNDEKHIKKETLSGLSEYCFEHKQLEVPRGWKTIKNLDFSKPLEEQETKDF
jgi:hypothetical protein